MPNKRCNVFRRFADLDEANCTVEEREEYEPHIASGGVVFAGVDYKKILHAAEAEADIILWDGGNNDHPFIQPGYNIVVVDALRPTQLTTHYPGDSVLLRADLIVVNKVHAASQQQVATLQRELDKVVPHTDRILAASPVSVDTPERLAGARIMIIEDGPTITHGGMPHGAGFQAVRNLNIGQIVDPREFATPEIARVFAQYPHIGPVLPAMGYSRAQREAMVETIKRSKVDAVVSGSPIDLAHALALEIPVIRVHYGYQDTGKPMLLWTSWTPILPPAADQAPLVVLAIGGHGLSHPSETGYRAERGRINQLKQTLHAQALRGVRLLVVHGNGPQVGRLLRDDGDVTDLDIHTAQTQGELGYLISPGNAEPQCCNRDTCDGRE